MLDRRSVFRYSILGLGALILLTPILLLPLSPDNDTYHAMAFAMEQGRGLPYLGSWDQNFPGVIFYHWGAIKLFGLSDIGFRAVDVLNRLAICFLLYRLTTRFVDRHIAAFAVPLTALLYVNTGFWSAGQRDGFAVTWLILALLQVTAPLISKKRLIVFGLAIALATFIRPTNALFGLLLFVPISKGKLDWRDLWVSPVLAIAALLLLISPWAFVHNGLREFFLATVRFNLDVYTSHERGWTSLIESLSLPFYFHTLALIGCIVFFIRKKPAREILAYAVIAAATIIAMGKYFLYHFDILLPVTILFCVVALEGLGQMTKARLIGPLVLVSALAVLVFPYRLMGQFFKLGADEKALVTIHSNIASLEGYSRATERDVIAYLRSRSLIGSTEFLLLYPGLRWRSGHSGLSRFTTTYCMTMGELSDPKPFQLRWRRELDSVISVQRPKAIVAAQGPAYLFELSNVSPDSLLYVLPKTTALMKETYQLDTTIGGFNIYRLNAAR